jgi:hypothetical protein
VGYLMGIPSGQLQQLQKEAATFCGMTVVFCRKLNWNHLASCLEVYTGRLGYGVRDELLALVRMGTEMTSLRARALVKSGIKTPVDLVQAGEVVITQILMDGMPFHDDAPMQVNRTNVNSKQDEINRRKEADVIKGKEGDVIEVNKDGQPVALPAHKLVSPLDGIDNADRSRRVEACRVLAARIIKRAKEVINDELSRLNG